MKSIGVIVNPEKPEAGGLVPNLLRLASEKGLELFFDPGSLPPGLEAPTLPCESFAGRVDAVLTLGGDGTLLGAVRRMGRSPLPLLGVNLGKLGFLTSVTQDELSPALSALAENTVIASTRQLLDCRYANQGGDVLHTAPALNDIVLSWGASSHIAHLEVSVDGEEITTYTCDGLIVATPTGSTGHSLSAGGPILHPESDALVISPICPHAMTVRPVVLSGNTGMTIRLSNQSKSLVLAIDGQSAAEIHPGGRVVVTPSETRVDLLHLPGYKYWEVLRRKLHWRGTAISHT